MKFATERPYADPERAARKLVEIANSVEALQEGRIFIELINAPMLFEHKASPAEYKAGLELAVAPRLSMAARIRNLCEVYAGRRGAVLLTANSGKPLVRRQLPKRPRQISPARRQKRSRLQATT